MQAATTSDVATENVDVPIARIDAQDESSVLPLREYLESHGVTVILNKDPGRGVTYHIVMGDGIFVKEIFSTHRQPSEKRLAIIVGFADTILTSHILQSKIVLVDPKELSGKQVVTIFEFFFTSDKDIHDFRAERETRTAHEKHPIENNYQKSVTVRDEERINSIIADVFGKPAKPPVHRRRKKQRQWMIGILITIGVIIIPFLWYFLSLTVSGLALISGSRAMIAGNTHISWQSRVAKYWIGQGRMVLHLAAVPLQWVGWQNAIRGQERLLSFFSDTATASDSVGSMLNVGQSVASGLLNQVDVTSTGTTSAADITSLRTSLDSVQNTLGLAQAELSLLLRDHTFPFSIHAVAQEGTKVTAELTTIRGFAATMDQLVSLFLQLAGFKESKNYLILLQNSTELRATGGFIGSVAVASFADGRMTDLQIHDVYTFDGQLKGHVEPPTPVRELLGQEHWYLRDSNWDPDFSVSAARAAWFYQKETGTNVDGVFAMNTPFIVEMLKATGPLDLPDYNDRITADNFYGKSLYYTQNDFFPGSTQKKDFLGSLTRALTTKITTSKTTNMNGLFRAVTRALESHDLLMMFGTAELQSIVTHYGWAGVVPSESGCIGVTGSNCGFDPFIMVEANMGVNKVNDFISRSIDRAATINPNGSMTETETITVDNKSGEQGMTYRTYMRFLLPIDVAVSGVTIDGAPVLSRKDTGKPPVFPYVERTDTTSNFYVLGAGVEVPAGSQKHISITFTRDNVVRFSELGSVLDLFVQKQPGVSATPIHTVVSYPISWIAGVEEQAVGGGSQDFIAKPGQLEYNTVLDSDSITRVRFTK